MMSISQSIPLAFIQGVGAPELLIIFLILLLLFGAKKLPEVARGIGKSMGEFKKAKTEFEDEVRTAVDEEEKKASTPSSDEKPAEKNA